MADPYNTGPYVNSNYFAPKPKSSPTSFFGPTNLNAPQQQPDPGFVGPQQPTGPQQPQSNGFTGVGNYLASPGGQAVTGLVGGALESYQNQKNFESTQNLTAADKAAQLRERQFNADRLDQFNRASGVLNADPLGADQSYAQHNALMNAILPNLRNFRSQPGDSSVAAAMGGNRGGTMNALGPNGLDPAMIQQLFGSNATAAAIAQRHQEINSLDPNAAQPNFQSLFGDGPEAAHYQQQVSDWASQLQQKTGAEKAAYEQQIQGYIDQMVQKEGEDNSSGFWHKFARIAAIVGAATATVLTAGGASPLLVAAIGAGAGAAGGWGNGGGVKGALLGAAVGGATAGFGSGGSAAAKAVSTGAQTATNIAKTAATNPALYGAILNR